LAIPFGHSYLFGPWLLLILLYQKHSSILNSSGSLNFLTPYYSWGFFSQGIGNIWKVSLPLGIFTTLENF